MNISSHFQARGNWSILAWLEKSVFPFYFMFHPPKVLWSGHFLKAFDKSFTMRYILSRLQPDLRSSSWFSDFLSFHILSHLQKKILKNIECSSRTYSDMIYNLRKFHQNQKSWADSGHLLSELCIESSASWSQNMLRTMFRSTKHWSINEYDQKPRVKI